MNKDLGMLADLAASSAPVPPPTGKEEQKKPTRKRPAEEEQEAAAASGKEEKQEPSRKRPTEAKEAAPPEQGPTPPAATPAPAPAAAVPAAAAAVAASASASVPVPHFHRPYTEEECWAAAEAAFAVAVRGKLGTREEDVFLGTPRVGDQRIFHLVLCYCKNMDQMVKTIRAKHAMNSPEYDASTFWKPAAVEELGRLIEAEDSLRQKKDFIKYSQFDLPDYKNVRINAVRRIVDASVSPWLSRSDRLAFWTEALVSHMPGLDSADSACRQATYACVMNMLNSADQGRCFTQAQLRTVLRIDVERDAWIKKGKNYDNFYRECQKTPEDPCSKLVLNDFDWCGHTTIFDICKTGDNGPDVALAALVKYSTHVNAWRPQFCSLALIAQLWRYGVKTEFKSSLAELIVGFPTDGPKRLETLTHSDIDGGRREEILQVL